jgi:hypothetical protein
LIDVSAYDTREGGPSILLLIKLLLLKFIALVQFVKFARDVTVALLQIDWGKLKNTRVVRVMLGGSIDDLDELLVIHNVKAHSDHFLLLAKTFRGFVCCS